jgi:cyclopropane fatty-acyl-phospholipid synthase-like methyltransferase
VGFYDTEEGVEQYVELAEGYDGAELIEVLRHHLPEGSRVLELGMGPGVDLDLLARTYEVTGSDSSQVFLDRYRADHPDADLLLLDARTLETERSFDAVFSNKVLHHLTREELRASLGEQTRLLPPGGLAMHSFWWGEEDEEPMQGLLFARYTESELIDLISGIGYELAEMARYTEMEDDDSLWVVLRKP